ncbi:hypothetical protein F5Y01DRAFT_322462 [Xylaria sp. FL0043]|nr:hypothetical protein F5Y01DRAFT_322462 [Xylaria sp. FL0043]
MSFLDSSTCSRTWLPVLGLLQDDPYRSRNTIAYARTAYCARLFQESVYVKHLGNGAIFSVSLYKHPDRLFAVKKAKTDNAKKEAGAKQNPAKNVIVALREIQVVSNQVLQHHSNIIRIIGWDWDDLGVPVLFTEFAEQGTLKDFLRQNPNLGMAQRHGFALDIACGLNALHMADVAHGDVKLANTLVFPNVNQPGQWTVKVSDFSHSIFGISSRRITTYPGTGLYNAPEVRSREALIPSDRLPRCEAFSFGLLAWEILKNGESYFDLQWTSSSSNIEGSSMVHTFLSNLRKDELLELAHKFLMSRYDPGSRYDFVAFGQIFEMSLKDNPNLRKDIQSIAIALDYCDRADIIQFSDNRNITSIGVWVSNSITVAEQRINVQVKNFNPWDKEPWPSRVQFVRELEVLLSGPLTPSHAEYNFLLSRCYAEGYGVEPNLQRAADYLYEAGRHDSLEARWLIELCWKRLFSGSSMFKRLMGSNTVFEAVIRIVNAAKRRKPDIKSRVERKINFGYKTYINSWTYYDWLFTSQSGFRTGNDSTNIQWTSKSISRFIKEVVEPSGKPLCDIIVSYQTLLTPSNTTTFLESCVTLGPEVWNTVSWLIPKRAEEYSETSYGNLGELYFRLLLAAAKSGHFEISCSLIQVIEGLQNQATQRFSLESATGESPMHHLANFKASGPQMSVLINSLQALGFDIDAPITARSWISPHGIELYGTPLQIAVRYRSPRTVWDLVAAGADVDLGYNDTPAPLSIATSLGDATTVAYLLQKCSPEKAKNGIKALGIPPSRGWFEHLVSDVKTQVTGFSLVETALEYFKKFTGNKPWGRHLTRFSVHIDGSPLIEAIHRGQRNLGVLATLIELGLGPRSAAKRWALLEAALKLDVGDPFRARLLHFLFSRREVENAGFCGTFADINVLHTTAWFDEWPTFFRTFRVDRPGNNGSTIFHVLAIREDYQALQIILTFFPHISVSVHLLGVLDNLGMGPICIARKCADKSLYQLLRNQVWTFGREFRQSYRELRLRDVSQETLDEEWIRRKVAKYPDWVTAPAYVRRGGVFSQAIIEKYRTQERERALQATAREFDERIASLLNQGIGWITTAEAIEKYACWVLQNEHGALRKVEDLIVVTNLMRMITEAEISGIATDKELESSWRVPDKLTEFYQKQTLVPGSPAKMIMIAHSLLLESSPKWIRGIETQSHQTGIESILEWFMEHRFRDKAQKSSISID